MAKKEQSTEGVIYKLTDGLPQEAEFNYKGRKIHHHSATQEELKYIYENHGKSHGVEKIEAKKSDTTEDGTSK